MNSVFPLRRSTLLGTALALGALACSTGEVAAIDFRDTSGHWAEPYIDILSDMGILGGFPDGTFRPNERVTRAQFATIANQVFQRQAAAGSVPSSAAPFLDVPRSHWASANIAAANASGLVAGFPDGSFQPDLNVTRAQSLVVMVNGLQVPTVPVAETNGLLSQYRDGAVVPAWAASSLATAAQLNLPANYPDPALLAPNRSASRAEVAAFAYQTLVSQGAIAPLASFAPTGPTAVAQLPPRANSPQSRSNNPQFDLQVSSGLAAGTRFPSATLAAERLFLDPDETRPFSIFAFDSVRNDRSEIAIPYGARIDGRFESAPGGVRFVAETIAIDNQIYPFAAQSSILHDVKDPRQTGTVQVVQDAAIGAAVGAVLAGVAGDRAIATEEVLAGGVAGAAIGNITAPRVVVIDPEDPIELRLTQGFEGAFQ
ncbi:S-layer homology domain-containing protein [Synechococcus sp. PCC 7336]|uniref:S-layer homology domain-containing protein n=1 Tax=Synechococcus sp. PCC 7336 TaxID=195250 RepID=UPI00034C7168|nr:S-layer homology domain-containing protein [Synechococcus sp. PCC 7336]